MTEAMTINNLGFTELSQVDLMGIDGGSIPWDAVGASVSAFAGGELGFKIGTAVGGPTVGAIGAIAGVIVAVALYYVFD